MSQYTMQYGGGAGTGRAGSLLTPLLPRIAVGATHSSTLWHGSREQAMLCHVWETHQGRRQYSRGAQMADRGPGPDRRAHQSGPSRPGASVQY